MSEAGLRSLIVGLLLASVIGCAQQDPEMPVVGLLTFAPDPLTERSIRGVEDGLGELGWIHGETLRLVHHDAQGDPSTMQSIAQKYLADRVDVIVPMTTPCLIAAANVVAGTGQVVVFTEVYDPFRAGVAWSSTDHPPNLVGVASPPPIEQTLELLCELLPTAHRIGTIYNPGEVNAVLAVERIRAGVAARGLELVERTVSSSGDVHQAARALVGEIDALYITGDNTVGIGFDTVVAAAADGKIPLFCNTPVWAERGAAAALGPDFYLAGRTAAAMIDQILRGADPANMEILLLDAQELQLNLSAAAEQGLELPQDVVKRAATVLHE